MLRIGSRRTGAPAVKASADGLLYTSRPGLPPGVSTTLLAAGRQVATAIVSVAGVAVWTLAAPAPDGARMTYTYEATASAGFAPVTGYVAPAPKLLPALSAAPLVAYHVKSVGSSYTGPSCRVARVSDGVQADIGWDGYGQPSLAEARAFAGVSALRHGVLVIVTSYDTTGAGAHMTWSSGTAAVPFVSDRDAYGPANPDRACVSISSQKYSFTGINAVQRFGTIPTSVSVNARGLAAFLVANPMQSLQRNALFTIGATTGANRVTLYTEGSSGTLGLGSLGTTNGSAGTDTKAPFALLPRNNAQVLSVTTSAAGKRIQVEDRVFSGANVEDSRTLTGGGFGVTGGGNTYFLDADFYAFALYPALPDAEADQVRAVLADSFATARRSRGLFVVGSSTPEGQGATNNRSWPRLMAGQLGAPVDVWNGSLSGQTLASINATAAERVFPALAGYVAPVLIIDGAANDFLQNSTDAQVYASLKSLIAAFKAAFPSGKAVVVTPTGKSNATASQDNNRLSYIAMVKAGKADLGWDACFDRAGIPQAQTLTDPTYFRQEPDGSWLHANDNLHELYAQGAVAAVQSVLAA